MSVLQTISKSARARLASRVLSMTDTELLVLLPDSVKDQINEAFTTHCRLIMDDSEFQALLQSKLDHVLDDDADWVQRAWDRFLPEELDKRNAMAHAEESMAELYADVEDGERWDTGAE